MECVEGDTLLEYAQKNNLALEERLKLFEQICLAVEYAHRQNVLHRDLKPSNILVANDGTPKLLDFGIAKLTDDGANQEMTEMTLTGKWLMTPEYASPEQVRGEPLTPASDVYSLGIILYNLLTDKAPYKFPSRAPHEISRVICEVTPTRPISTIMRQPINSASSIEKSRTTNKMNRSADELLERIVLKALRKNPAERYQSAREFAEDIANYLCGEMVFAPDYEIQKIAAEKGLSRWRAVGQGALVILYGILAVVIAIMIDSATNSLLPYELPAIIFLAFFVAAIRRVIYPIQTVAVKEESWSWRSFGQGALLVLYGILTVAIVAMIDSALDSLLPYELPAIIFLAFLAAGFRRVVYPKQSVK
jgi:serine/threonine-protein kinase